MFKLWIIFEECNPTEFHGECHFNFIRKMASSFSWDWVCIEISMISLVDYCFENRARLFRRKEFGNPLESKLKTKPLLET